MLTQNSQVKPEYLDYSIVAKVLTRARFENTVVEDITAHDFSTISYGIIRYQINGTKAFPLSIHEFDAIWKDLKEENVPKYEIVGNFQRGKIRVDIVSCYQYGMMETRCMWAEPTLDEPILVLQSKSGATIKSSWQTKAVANNKWLRAYRTLWTERNRQRVQRLDTTARLESELEQEEIEYIRSLELAMY